MANTEALSTSLHSLNTSTKNKPCPYDEADIAIIGVACRFPGAKSYREFWHNLINERESIRFFDDETLLEAGVSAKALADKYYVKASAYLDEATCFDADFFAMSPRDAELMDPQQRKYIESAYSALEDAGYPNGGESTGIYAGSAMNTYLLNKVVPAQADNEIDPYQAMLLNDKDYLATRTAYLLNLKGPAISVQSACSTSLAAVHVACQALLNGECDMALAGGVCIRFPQETGYRHQSGMILSLDGHCRPFDSQASGTLGASGVGNVVLKRASEAWAANDNIRAIIAGSAMNNDGGEKMGFTAPSIDGQAEVIQKAMAVAGVSPHEISYVEAHGTGTHLGDPIEMSALQQAFFSAASETADDNAQAPLHCAVGSVKSNFGHLDVAAGIAGLIKTVLSLEEKTLPASLNFRSLNPDINIHGSGFYIQNKTAPWTASGRRSAGVSSFGIGGTNVHVIVREALAKDAEPVASPGDAHLILVSAKSAACLTQGIQALYEHIAGQLSRDPNMQMKLADVAYTLACGRGVFPFRRAFVVTSADELVAQLGRYDNSDAAVSEPLFTATGARTAQAIETQLVQYLDRRGESYTRATIKRDALYIAAHKWEKSAALDLSSFFDTRRRIIPLPTYPFASKRYLLECKSPSQGRAEDSPRTHSDVVENCYQVLWQAQVKSARKLKAARANTSLTTLVLANPTFEFAALARCKVDYFTGVNEAFRSALDKLGNTPVRVVHALTLDRYDSAESQLADPQLRACGILSVLALIKILDSRGQKTLLHIVTEGSCNPLGTDLLRPENAALLALAKVINRECPHVNTYVSDCLKTRIQSQFGEILGAEKPLTEPAQTEGCPLTAYRHGQVWRRCFLPLPRDFVQGEHQRQSSSYEALVCLINGGGAIGQHLALYLAQTQQAKIVLLSRSALSAEDETALAHSISSAGGTLALVQADVGDIDDMRRSLAKVQERLGHINAVVHTAGDTAAGFLALIEAETIASAYRAKVQGLEVLRQVLPLQAMRFIVLCSSISAEVGEPGLAGYCAANAVLDLMAEKLQQQGCRAVSINWDTWYQQGMAKAEKTNRQSSLSIAEGLAVFAVAMEYCGSRLCVSKGSLYSRIRRSINSELIDHKEVEYALSVPKNPSEDTEDCRKNLSTDYCAPSDEIETFLQRAWQKAFGFDAIGVMDDFYELGGDSLLAVSILGTIEKKYACRINLADFFAEPNIRAVARHLQLVPSE